MIVDMPFPLSVLRQSISMCALNAMQHCRNPRPPRLTHCPVTRRRFALCALMAAHSTVASAQGAAATNGNAQALPAAGTHSISARIVAVGITGVQGVRQVGMFHSGGPITNNPEFLLKTRRGRVLDPQRILVASSANFGSEPADTAQIPGTVLSIDPRGKEPLKIPAQFAAKGGQSETANGMVKVYSSQSPSFLNSEHNPRARTASQTAVAGPRYISMNNAFGRPWIANSPFGAKGVGTVTVVDPDGTPLNNAPSTVAGGVFFGTLTSRVDTPVARAGNVITRALNYRASGQLTKGALVAGALGTAFLGPSPDGTGFAVFAVATADGGIVQVHVQDGVDGLAPAGTTAPPGSKVDQGVIGMAFKWNPDRALYVTDQLRNRVAVLELTDDTKHFKLSNLSYLSDAAFNGPIDIAAAVPEVANPRFSSHTTVAGGSDLYVANRGDGSLLRIDQSGRVLARAVIHVPGLGTLGANRLRALAVSADAQRLWLTVQGELPGFAGFEGALIEVSAFDATGPFELKPMVVEAVPETDLARAGHDAFHKSFSPAEGLGPLFNARSCVACHNEPTSGGMNAQDKNFAIRVARMQPVTGRLDNVDGINSPIARRHSIRELGHRDAPAATIPRQANVTSLRMPLFLYSSAALDDIPDSAILAHAVSKGDGIKGRPNRVVTVHGEQRVGRYGWKADIANLDEMVAVAYTNELGITSPLAPGVGQKLDDDGGLVRAVVSYLRTLSKSQP